MLKVALLVSDTSSTAGLCWLPGCLRNKVVPPGEPTAHALAARARLGRFWRAGLGVGRGQPAKQRGPGNPQPSRRPGCTTLWMHVERCGFLGSRKPFGVLVRPNAELCPWLMGKQDLSEWKEKPNSSL